MHCVPQVLIRYLRFIKNQTRIFFLIDMALNKAQWKCASEFSICRNHHYLVSNLNVFSL